jgi:hypothetical protein
MRIPPAMKAVLSRLARQRTTDATTLARIWLAERLQQEIKTLGSFRQLGHAPPDYSLLSHRRLEVLVVMESCRASWVATYAAALEGQE